MTKNKTQNLCADQFIGREAKIVSLKCYLKNKCYLNMALTHIVLSQAQIEEGGLNIGCMLH